MTTIYVTFLNVINDINIFLFISKVYKSCIQLFFFRKLQYFKSLSCCANITESCLVLSEIFFVEILSRPECSGCDKLPHVKVYTSKNPKS